MRGPAAVVVAAAATQSRALGCTGWRRRCGVPGFQGAREARGGQGRSRAVAGRGYLAGRGGGLEGAGANQEKVGGLGGRNGDSAGVLGGFPPGPRTSVPGSAACLPPSGAEMWLSWVPGSTTGRVVGGRGVPAPLPGELGLLCGLEFSCSPLGWAFASRQLRGASPGLCKRPQVCIAPSCSSPLSPPQGHSCLFPEPVQAEVPGIRVLPLPLGLAPWSFSASFLPALSIRFICKCLRDIPSPRT